MRVADVSAMGHSELLMRLAQAGAQVQRALSRDEILHRACEALSSLGLRCSLAHPADGGVRVHAVSLGEQLRTIEDAMRAPLVGPVRPMTPFVQRVWDEGYAYTSEWPEEAARFTGVPLADLLRTLGGGGFMRGIGVRIAESGTRGMMLFATGAWLHEEDAGAFRLFAEQLGAALDAARTVAQLRQRNAELAALNSLSAIAAASEELGPVLDAAADVIRDAAGASGVAIAVLAGGGGPLHSHVSAEGPVATLLRSVPAEEPRFHSVLREGAVRVLHPEDVPQRVADLWISAGVQTTAVVPLRFRGDPLGAVCVAFPDHRDDDASHVHLLGALAGQLGAAIESHGLLETLRGRVAELSLLNEVAAATVALAPGSLLEEVLARVSSTFRADVSLVYLQENGRRSIAAQLGVEGDLSGAPPPSPNDIGELAVTRKQAMRWPGDIPETPRNAWFRARQRVHTAIAVPLLSTDRPLGCFVLGRRTPTPFSDQDARLLSAVGVQLGVAVESARLYEDLRQSYAALARAQEQLIQQERFAALGQLSAVVAHEVRNPVGVIFNSLGSLRRLVPAAGDARMLLEIIGEEADRLNRIVGDLLDFARPAAPALRREPLARVVGEAAGAAGLGPSIRFVSEVPQELPPVPMDPRLMRQALLNLFSNAAQAMPGGGTLSVHAALAGDAVRLEIADTGSGVPEELRQRIFEPFFTTRPTGTGLGLAVVKRILDDHRATITVEPADPVGSRFVVLLPLDAPEAGGVELPAGAAGERR